jgi:hypothetical protein
MVRIFVDGGGVRLATSVSSNFVQPIKFKQKI